MDPIQTEANSFHQTNPHCAAQIHSIIVALSLHVVVLIKDLNGNHVIQKCLNKLAPEDNQVRQIRTCSEKSLIRL